MIVSQNRDRIQGEIQRLNDELERARSDEQTREEQRKQELDSLQVDASKREEKLDRTMKKHREKAILFDEDERKLVKMKTYVLCTCST
jgi:hypothetical protein